MNYKIKEINLYVNFLRDGIKSPAEQNADSTDIDNFFDGNIEKRIAGDITELKVDVKCPQFPHIYARSMNAEGSIFADIVINETIDGVLSREQFNPFWSRPSFEKDLSKIPHNIQNILISLQNGRYVSVLPICSPKFNTVIVPSESFFYFTFLQKFKKIRKNY